MRLDVYDHGQNATIERLLAAFPPVVAAFQAVPDEIVGWVCREFHRPATHFLYVKHDYRRMGVGTTLGAGTVYHTHQTRAGDVLFKKLGSLFNPYLLSEKP